ncbi:hypothetical protein D3C71_2130420 [compost metagenome]
MLEGALAKARHLQQLLAAGKGPGLVAVCDDGIGNRSTEAGNPRQKRRGGGIEIDTDGIHRIFDDRVE